MLKTKGPNVQVLTTAWLRSHGADERHVRTFRAEFGDAAVLTGHVLRRMGVIGFDIDWLAATMLDSAFLPTYQERVRTAQHTFRSVIDPAIAYCERAIAESALRGRQGQSWRDAEIHREYRAILAASMKDFVEAQADAVAGLLGLD